MQVIGAEHFSDKSYLRWIRSQPGVEPNAAVAGGYRLDQSQPLPQCDLGRRTRKHARHHPTGTAGQERRPVGVFAGVDNTGTENTDEQRIECICS